MHERARPKVAHTHIHKQITRSKERERGKWTSKKRLKFLVPYFHSSFQFIFFCSLLCCSLSWIFIITKNIDRYIYRRWCSSRRLLFFPPNSHKRILSFSILQPSHYPCLSFVFDFSHCWILLSHSFVFFFLLRFFLFDAQPLSVVDFFLSLSRFYDTCFLLALCAIRKHLPLLSPAASVSSSSSGAASSSTSSSSSSSICWPIK